MTPDYKKNYFLYEKIFSSLVTALILGTLEITFILAYTALIFPAELSEFFTDGFAILLFGTIICFMTLALLSSYRGTIGSAQDIPASISAVIAISILAAMGAESNTHVVFSTIVAALALATFLSAILLIIMGFTGLGQVIRFIPYPVIGGLLISTGWILSEAGLSMMPDQWIIGACFAVLLLVIRQYFVSAWVLPALLLGAIVLINLYMYFAGISVEAAREMGLLLDVNLERIPFIPSPASIFNAADWDVVFNQFPTIISLCLITCLVVLIQISTIEVIVKQELEPKRELYATGLANLLVAFCCGLISYHHISSTTLAYNMGARTRTVGIFTALICMMVFFTNTRWMEFLPLPLLAGLILYLGLEFIYEWLIQAYSKIPRIEYITMLGIFACAVFVNFPAAIALGIISGILLFLFQYNTIGILQTIITEDRCVSSVMRPKKQADYLASNSHSTAAFKLKGMLYFGTAHELYEITKNFIVNSKTKQPKFIIFDFENVANFDSTALMSLLRTHQFTSKNNIQLIISSISSLQQIQIKTFYAEHDLTQSLIFIESLDHAIEETENQLLNSANLINSNEIYTIESVLNEQGWDANSVSRLKSYMDKVELFDHQHLIRSGEDNSDIFIITSGRLNINSNNPGGAPKRLRVLVPGMVVGELSLYSGLPRSADVIADGIATVYKLSLSSLDELQQKQPELAIKLHKYIARIMAQRFVEESNLQLIRSA